MTSIEALLNLHGMATFVLFVLKFAEMTHISWSQFGMFALAPYAISMTIGLLYIVGMVLMRLIEGPTSR